MWSNPALQIWLLEIYSNYYLILLVLVALIRLKTYHQTDNLKTSDKQSEVL